MPRSRRAAGAASAKAAAATKPCMLLQLSHDELGVVVHALCDPLRPLLAVQLGSTAKGLRAAMQAELQALRQQHEEVEAMAAAWFMSLAWLREKEDLRLGITWGIFDKPLALSHWKTLGMLGGCRSLPKLERLSINGSANGNEGVVRLAQGLGRGSLASLQLLVLYDTHIGPQGASALATTLNKRVFPALDTLSLTGNPLGDAGLAALLPGLCQLPTLKKLGLGKTSIGDQGVRSLVAEPIGAFESLDRLNIDANQITDAGCTMLASALRDGALPSLKMLEEWNWPPACPLELGGNPASQQAQSAVEASLKARS